MELGYRHCQTMRSIPRVFRWIDTNVIEFLISWIWVIVRVWLFNFLDPPNRSPHLIDKCQSNWRFLIFFATFGELPNVSA